MFDCNFIKILSVNNSTNSIPAVITYVLIVDCMESWGVSGDIYTFKVSEYYSLDYMAVTVFMCWCVFVFLWQINEYVINWIITGSDKGLLPWKPSH